jgi:signal peptidase I
MPKHSRWLYLLLLVALPACGNKVRQASGGMWPTIAPGDEVSLGPVQDVHRGALVVVADPDHPGQTHIRRVIAVAGDTFGTKADRAVVNGTTVPRCRVGAFDGSLPRFPDEHTRGDVFVEFLDGAAYLVFIDAAGLPGAKFDPPTSFKVAPGEVMVLGDNRLDSVGSNHWGAREGVGFAVASLGGQPVGFDTKTPHLFAGASQELVDGLARCMAKGAAGAE